jgi:hypothetical protein
MKSSDAYKIATEYVSRDESVIAEIGEVTGFGFLPGGNISINGPTGEAELSIHTKGERGSGTLYIKLTKSLGEWKIIEAAFETSSGRRFDLLVPDGEGAARNRMIESRTARSIRPPCLRLI